MTISLRHNDNKNYPKYWWLLNDNDRVGYTIIRTYIKNNPESNQRNKRLIAFTESLDIIKKYAIRGDTNDSNRCLVCGILWMNDAIAINTHQLGFLMSKCKSSINGSLQVLRYQEKIPRKTASDLVGTSLTAIKNDRSELRKWTVRCFIDAEIGHPSTDMSIKAKHLKKEIKCLNSCSLVTHDNDIIEISPVIEKNMDLQKNLNQKLHEDPFSNDSEILKNAFEKIRSHDIESMEFWNIEVIHDEPNFLGEIQ